MRPVSLDVQDLLGVIVNNDLQAGLDNKAAMTVTIHLDVVSAEVDHLSDHDVPLLIRSECDLVRPDGVAEGTLKHLEFLIGNNAIEDIEEFVLEGVERHCVFLSEEVSVRLAIC